MRMMWRTFGEVFGKASGTVGLRQLPWAICSRSSTSSETWVLVCLPWALWTSARPPSRFLPGPP
eukprot:9018342-Pyramimonas_sp.AAC.1